MVPKRPPNRRYIKDGTPLLQLVAFNRRYIKDGIPLLQLVALFNTIGFVYLSCDVDFKMKHTNPYGKPLLDYT